MKTSLIILALLILSSCTDPKKDPTKHQASKDAKTGGSLSSQVMMPVTAPIRAREQIRQQVRILNHQAQLRNQRLQRIEGQGRPGR